MAFNLRSTAFSLEFLGHLVENSNQHADLRRYRMNGKEFLGLELDKTLLVQVTNNLNRLNNPYALQVAGISGPNENNLHVLLLRFITGTLEQNPHPLFDTNNGWIKLSSRGKKFVTNCARAIEEINNTDGIKHKLILQRNSIYYHEDVHGSWLPKIGVFNFQDTFSPDQIIGCNWKEFGTVLEELASEIGEGQLQEDVELRGLIDTLKDTSLSRNLSTVLNHAAAN